MAPCDSTSCVTGAGTLYDLLMRSGTPAGVGGGVGVGVGDCVGVGVGESVGDEVGVSVGEGCGDRVFRGRGVPVASGVAVSAGVSVASAADGVVKGVDAAGDALASDTVKDAGTAPNDADAVWRLVAGGALTVVHAALSAATAATRVSRQAVRAAPSRCSNIRNSAPTSDRFARHGRAVRRKVSRANAGSRQIRLTTNLTASSSESACGPTGTN